MILSGIKGPAKKEISSFGMCLEDSVFWRYLITKRGQKFLGSLLTLFTQKYGDRKFIKEDRDVAQGAESAPPFQPRKSKQFSDTSCEKTHSVVAFSPKNCRPWIKTDSRKRAPKRRLAPRR